MHRPGFSTHFSRYLGYLAYKEDDLCDKLMMVRLEGCWVARWSGSAHTVM